MPSLALLGALAHAGVALGPPEQPMEVHHEVLLVAHNGAEQVLRAHVTLGGASDTAGYLLPLPVAAPAKPTPYESFAAAWAAQAPDQHERVVQRMTWGSLLFSPAPEAPVVEHFEFAPQASARTAPTGAQARFKAQIIDPRNPVSQELWMAPWGRDVGQDAWIQGAMQANQPLLALALQRPDTPGPLQLGPFEVRLATAEVWLPQGGVPTDAATVHEALVVTPTPVEGLQGVTYRAPVPVSWVHEQFEGLDWPHDTAWLTVNRLEHAAGVPWPSPPTLSPADAPLPVIRPTQIEVVLEEEVRVPVELPLLLAGTLSGLFALLRLRRRRG